LTEPFARRGATKRGASIDLGEAEPRVDQDDDRAQAAPHREVFGHHLLPAQLGACARPRVAVARQVGEQRVGGELRAELEQVDVLRAARRLRREGEALLLGQDVDRVDLPAFERPTKATSGSSVAGRLGKRLAVVRKRAVCVQASALRVAASSSAACGRAAEVGMGCS
jgi:hypothetical protein